MKLHQLSLVFRALPRGVQLGSFGFFAVTVVTTTVAAVPSWFALTVAATIGGFLAGVGYEFLYYRRFEYELTADTLDIGSGVLSRREREIPIRRIQNVDISRGIVQRALSIAAVGIETAGGGETEADLRYVSYEEAKRLQRDIRRRKRGASDEPTIADEDENESQGELLFALTHRNLVLLGLVAPDLRALLPVLFFAVPTLGISIPELLAESGAFGVGPRGAALAVVSWVGTAAVTAARYYEFRLTRFGDELRYERGLLSRYDGSIPIDKIQQIDVRENVLMRRLGYGSLAVETAGYTPGEGPSGGSEAAIPLAERGRVLDFARSIDGFAFDEPAFSHPPSRARRRYAVRYALVIALVTGVLYALDTGLATAVGRPLGGNWGTILEFWYVPLVALAVVPFAAHYKWCNRGYDVGAEHVLTRNGFWRRTIAVVPAYRVQTVIQTATPFQRWRSLASVAIDTAGSLSVTDRGARAVDFDANEATTLRETVRRRLDESLALRRDVSPTNDSADDVPNRAGGDEDHA
ncbi:PH domain-containing protein [Halococcus dombrowskii]|uniref:PH domain-containing protein n=1 Tax=Halococcus dombrowskii TaxID=179637 RepID=A0AAV3SKJ7_HALDO|nr:PH domain-containing protein [Halococcus dombrowskii]UOO96429.1 PH domain-containing protein [Halococcus dombrowskii]